MAESLPMAGANMKLNLVGLEKSDYRGSPTTLCQGCGHNSIANQIVAACYEADIVPEDVVKFSGIGCSSKSPTYFLNRSFGFNGLHGRMPSVATGALFGDTRLRGIGLSEAYANNVILGLVRTILWKVMIYIGATSRLPLYH